MAEREATAMWRTRLRWRLAGAWQWPAFGLLTVVDAIVLARLPFAGGRSDFIGSVVAAGLLNVIVIATVPVVGGPLLRRRRPQLPREVAADQVGTAGLVVLFVVLLGLGIAHRPALRANDHDTARAIARSTTFAAHHAPREFLPLHGSDTVEHGSGLFRTCFPGRDPRRDYCVWALPSGTVHADRDETPNATLSGPDNPGRLSP